MQGPVDFGQGLGQLEVVQLPQVNGLFQRLARYSDRFIVQIQDKCTAEFSVFRKVGQAADNFKKKAAALRVQVRFQKHFLDLNQLGLVGARSETAV